jgi:hypothetical protein
VSERAKVSDAPDSKLGAEDNQVPASSNRQAYVSNEYVPFISRKMVS